MSDPARFFQSLNLDDMPVTRSQSQVPPHRGGRNPGGRGRGRGRAQPPPQPPSPIRGPSGIRYNTQTLSPTSIRRANEGLQSTFTVDRVHSHGSGSQRYYAFQLSKPVSIRLHDPAGGPARVYECSCEYFERTQRPCVHVWWLFGCLHAELGEAQEASGRRPRQIELPAQFSALYPFIPPDNLAALTRALNRIDGDDVGGDDVGGYDEDQEMDELDFRKDTLCDILASFNDQMLPSEVSDELSDKVSDLSPDEVLVQRDLPATIYRLAMQDDTLFTRLQEVVPHDVRASQYYETQYRRAQAAMQRLSQYARTGPPEGRSPGSPVDLDVPKCAKVLRSLVHQMCEDRDVRNAVSPLGEVVASRLAVILVRIIHHVIELNKDIYEGTQWNRTRSPNEHPRDRNLFVHLIGDPPYNAQFPPWMTDYFVIDRLRRFPKNEWKSLFETLTTIKDHIEDMDWSAMPKSPQYVSQIDEMLRDYTATADEPSSSSSQMPRHR